MAKKRLLDCFFFGQIFCTSENLKLNNYVFKSIDNLLSGTIILLTAATSRKPSLFDWEVRRKALIYRRGFERVNDTSLSVLEMDDFDGTFEEFAACFKSTQGFSSK